MTSKILIDEFISQIQNSIDLYRVSETEEDIKTSLQLIADQSRVLQFIIDDSVSENWEEICRLFNPFDIN
jgi:hypothetical protein